MTTSTNTPIHPAPFDRQLFMNDLINRMIGRVVGTTRDADEIEAWNRMLQAFASRDYEVAAIESGRTEVTNEAFCFACDRDCDRFKVEELNNGQ